jgi:hypothetical protein
VRSNLSTTALADSELVLYVAAGARGSLLRSTKRVSCHITARRMRSMLRPDSAAFARSTSPVRTSILVNWLYASQPAVAGRRSAAGSAPARRPRAARRGRSCRSLAPFSGGDFERRAHLRSLARAFRTASPISVLAHLRCAQRQAVRASADDDRSGCARRRPPRARGFAPLAVLHHRAVPTWGALADRIKSSDVASECGVIAP